MLNQHPAFWKGVRIHQNSIDLINMALLHGYRVVSHPEKSRVSNFSLDQEILGRNNAYTQVKTVLIRERKREILKVYPEFNMFSWNLERILSHAMSRVDRCSDAS